MSHSTPSLAALASRLARRGPAWCGNFLANLREAPTLVLMYHRVADVTDDPEQLAVSPARFEAQMAHLAAHCQLPRFEEEWRGGAGLSVVVTFDDGYVDNYRVALPILERRGVPATFFVSSGTVGDCKGFWWDRLALSLLCGDKFPERLLIEGRDHDSSRAEARERLYRWLQVEMKGMEIERRERVLAELASGVGRAREVGEANRPMSLAEVKALAAAPLATLGSHTINHIRLSALPEDRQRREIVGGHHQLEDMLGRRLEVFSYPFGTAEDYDERCVALCREAGFTKVATCDTGAARRQGDPMRIPRLIVRDWSLDEFKRQLWLARWVR